MFNFNFGIFKILIATFCLVKAQYSIIPSGTNALKNAEFHLTCNLGPSSTVPAFAITWRRNGVSAVLIQSSNCQTFQGSGGQELYQRYTYNCTSNRSYNLYISATQINNEDGSVWRCEDNDPRFGFSSDYNLIVYDPPTSDPVISGQSGTPTYQGDTIILTCSLTGGNPLATLTWTCKGLTVQGLNANTQTSAISRYTVTIDSSYNGQRCTCTASHKLWSDNKVVQSQPFVVHYPPTENPVISGYDGTFRYKDDIVSLTCTVSGGSPLATLSWTCNGQQQTTNIQSTSDSIVTSNVSVTMSKELNGKACICHGKHSDKRYSPNITSRSFIVYFPPTVEVIFDKSSPSVGETVTMFCLARGEPDSYGYGGWVQEYKNTIIRSVNNLQNFTISRLTHQDIGTYRCRAHNSITDINGVLYQQGTKNLDIKFSALFNSSRNFYTELNKTVEIRIPFFANPLLQNKDTITLTKQNINQKERTDIQMNIGTTTMDIIFYGKTINVEGQQVTIRMFQFKSELLGNYTIGIKNYDQGSISTFDFEVTLSGPPEHPKDFRILMSTSDSVTVTWRSGNNGGHRQTFVIAYQQTGKDETLKTKNVTEIDKKINYTVTISGLTSETEYGLSIYSYNSRGNTKQNILPAKKVSITTKGVTQCETNYENKNGIVIGIVIGVIVGALVEGIVISILLWRKGILNGMKCITVNGGTEQKSQYETTDGKTLDVHVYDGINPLNEDVLNHRESIRSPNEYEIVNNRQNSDEYQQLHHKGGETIEMSSVYVYKTMK